MQELQSYILNLKRQYGKLIDNIIYDELQKYMSEAECYPIEGGILVVVQESFRKRAYFAAKDNEVLSELIQHIPEGVMVEYFYRSENALDEIFCRSGLKPYQIYERRSSCYASNPYEIPRIGRKKLLQDMYDPTMGEYARTEDAEELYELCLRDFDPLSDHLLTVEEWRERLENQNCKVVRESHDIITFYVWRLEGRKLYSFLSYNTGPANLLYNLERQVFEDYWEQGIRNYYYWVRLSNTVMMRKTKGEEESMSARKSYSVMYDALYRKSIKQ